MVTGLMMCKKLKEDFLLKFFVVYFFFRFENRQNENSEEEGLLKASGIDAEDEMLEKNGEREKEEKKGEETSKELLDLENKARYERNDMVNFDIVKECQSRQKNELSNSKYVKITISE